MQSRVRRLPAVTHGVELTRRNRDDSLSPHESQDAIDRIFERRIRFSPCRSIPSGLITRTVVAFELHRRDVVHRAHQKIQQRKEQIFFPASPDQFGNKVRKTKHFKLPPGRLCNQPGNVQHVRVVVPHYVICLILRAGGGGNRNDIVRREVCGNETHLVQSIDSNAVIYHECHKTNGDIEVIASTGNGGTHQSRPENPRRKSPAASVHDHLLRYPLGLAVSKIEKLHILVQVGLVKNTLDRPAKHEGSRDVIEALRPSFERQSQNLIRPPHVRVTHPVVIEQVVYGCTVMEHRIDFIRQEIPHPLRQSQFPLAKISANWTHTILEHLHQLCRARPHRFHRRPQSLLALLLVGRPHQNVDIRTRLFQQTLHQERPNEARSTSQQNMIQDWRFRQQPRPGRLEDELPVVAHHPLFRRALFFTESRQRMSQRSQGFFGSPLQLFGQPKQFRNTHPLNQTNIHLPRQHIGAFIFQKFLDLVHEHNKIQGIQPGFDQVVRFRARQAITGFQYVERRLPGARGWSIVFFPRKFREHRKLTLQPHVLGFMAHDLSRTGSRDRPGRDKRNQRHFHVEVIPHSGCNLQRIRQRFRIFHLNHDRQRRLAVFINLERSNAIGPDQPGRLLHHGLDILRVIVLPAENNHVLDAAADEEFAVVEKTHIAGPKVAIVVGAVVHQSRVKQLQRQFRIIPETLALTPSRNPDLADSTRLQGHVLLRIHNLYRDPRQRSSTTDNLRGRADLGNLRSHAGLPQRHGVLVDRNNIAAVERNRQRILRQPVRHKKAFRLKSMGLKGLQKPFKSLRFDGFRGNHQQPERTKIATLQTLLRKPPGAQAIVVSEVWRR